MIDQPADASPGANREQRLLLRDADAMVYIGDLEHPSVTSDDAHHLYSVLRLTAQSTVVACDGQGSFRLCRLKNTRSNELDPDGPILSSPAPSPVTVGFAIVKADRNDWAVQKLTELGVDHLVPFLAERSVVRLDGPARKKRGERFRRIAREASAQCRRTRLPQIDDIVTFGELELSSAITALAEPGGECLGETRRIFVGPEGGWSKAELMGCERHVDLGPTILRAETAAIVAGVRLVDTRSSCS